MFNKRSLRLPLVAFGCGLVAAVAAAPARLAAEERERNEQWSRFRGPHGAGIAADREVPLRWSERQGILWRSEIPGVGHSSPVIWNNRLFVQSSSSDGSERLLLCLNTEDGSIVWKRSVPGSAAHTNEYNTLASSTPTTDGQRVYAAVWDGTEVAIHAYDFQGNPLWHTELGRFTSQHGFGSSPIVSQGKVILANDQDGSAELVALDAQNGSRVWQAPRKPFRACYSVPLVTDRDGAPELIVASTAGITGYDPRTGQENWNYVWKFDGMPLRTVASPLVSGGMVFINSGDGSGARHTIAVKAGGKGDVTQTNLVWESRRDFPYVPTMLTYGDYLFYVSDMGMASCRIAATGKVVWNERLSGKFFASPILVDGKIHAVNTEGRVYVFAAAPNYQQLARNSIGEPVFASPAVADNRLYIRGMQHLFCIGNNGQRTAR
jgi:outer membrane protein assembly factor BamB